MIWSVLFEAWLLATAGIVAGLGLMPLVLEKDRSPGTLALAALGALLFAVVLVRGAGVFARNAKAQGALEAALCFLLPAAAILCARRVVNGHWF